MKPRVLIVGTVPYNKRSSSRAFESYFHNWDKKCLAQVFSHPKKPTKGHCSQFYQITDQQMLKKRFGKIVETGVIFSDNELEDEWNDDKIEVKSSVFKRLYKIGARKTSLTHYLRKFVWNKKYWCNVKFNNWLEDFDPQCVFLSFSNDFFIPQIALYVAEKFNIPIVSSIGDDYYFNTKFSLSPIYHLYKTQYKKLIYKILNYKGSAIYIGDKIRDKYNSEFPLDGETVYLTSDFKRHEFREIDTDNPVISYCGNIRCGRYINLLEIATALSRINAKYKLTVYSAERDYKFIKPLENHPNIIYGGSIPYNKVEEVTMESDIVVLVEGMRKKDICLTRYSVSTKVADSLCSGSNIFCYGTMECGVIEYAALTKGAQMCFNKDDLQNTLSELIFNKKKQRELYNYSGIAAQKNHILEKSCQTFENVVKKAIEKGSTNDKR